MLFELVGSKKIKNRGKAVKGEQSAKGLVGGRKRLARRYRDGVIKGPLEPLSGQDSSGLSRYAFISAVRPIAMLCS